MYQQWLVSTWKRTSSHVDVSWTTHTHTHTWCTLYTLPIYTHTAYMHTHTHTHTHPTLPIHTHTHTSHTAHMHTHTHPTHMHTHPPHTACVKDLIRSLRDDDSSCEIRRQLGKACILQKVASWITFVLVLQTISVPQPRSLSVSSMCQYWKERMWLARLTPNFYCLQFVAEFGWVSCCFYSDTMFWPSYYYRTCCRFSSPLLVTQCFEMMSLGTDCILSIL